MTKHTPVIELPWHVGRPTSLKNAVEGQRGIWGGRTGKTGVADVYGYPVTAAYVARSANAYPRLVEALRDLSGLVAAYPKAFNAHEVNMAEHLRNAQDLLAELGE